MIDIQNQNIGNNMVGPIENDLIYTTTDIREVIVNSLIKSDRKIFEFMFVSGACLSLCRILCDFFAFCLFFQFSARQTN